MCSICGEINFRTPPDITYDRQMSETMTHRGPDQHGQRIAGAASLWHNRLAVIDPANGVQPMRAVWKII